MCRNFLIDFCSRAKRGVNRIHVSWPHQGHIGDGSLIQVAVGVVRAASSAASSPLKNDAASAVSTKPASIRLRRTGESSSASAAVNARSSEETAGEMPVERSNSGSCRRQQQPPPGVHPRGGVARDLEHLHHALDDRSAHVFGGVLETYAVPASEAAVPSRHGNLNHRGDRRHR
jgi:hypothetical protein